jgi:hypothetical protein
MALHDDIDQESRIGPKPESFVHFVRREDKREKQTQSSNSFDNDRDDDPFTRTDSFARALISAWLVATLLAGALLFLQPASSGPRSHAIGPSLVQAPLPRSADQLTYECSDLDYAYERC